MGGFWEYPDSSGDEELEIPDREYTPDTSPPSNKKRKQAEAILLDLDTDTPEPPKRSKPAAAAPVLDDAEDLELVRCLAQTQRSDASGAHARDDDDAAAAAGAEGDEAEAARLRQMRAEVLAAFQRDEDEETSEDDDEVVATPVEKRSARRRRQQEVVDPDEEEDVDAELERARQAAMRSTGAGPADDADGALVIKVQCKHGSVQIRQPREAHFEELLQKFLKYATEHKWCARGAACTLKFDGDEIDAANDTPEGLGMDTGEAIDALLS